MRSQTDYWDRVANEKTFSHPLRLDWMRPHLSPLSLILDYGCGYGRTLEALGMAGYINLAGVDFSDCMLRRCRARYPEVSLVRNDGRILPFRDGAVEAVLLLAVLTCIPDDETQRTLIAEIRRVLRRGGLLYVSDLLLNEDVRNVERYKRDANRYGVYGTFELPEGVTVRHHSSAWIDELMAPFDRLQYEAFAVTTMNGNRSAAFQYLGRS